MQLQQILAVNRQAQLLDRLIKAHPIQLSRGALGAARRHPAQVVAHWPTDQMQVAERRGDSRQAVAALQGWLRSHVISYTWLADELLPNPDFAFPSG